MVVIFQRIGAFQGFKLKDGIAILSIAVMIIISANMLKEYLVFDAEYIFSMALSIFVIQIKSLNPKFSINIAILALCLFALYYYLSLSTLYYFGFWFTILYIISIYYGHINIEFIILLFVNSPIFTYALKVFGFPIRLWITKVACKAMALCGIDVTSAGNNILVQGNEFSVEPACSGINMMVAGLAITLALTKVGKEKFKVNLPNRYLFFSLTMCFILLVLSNIIRIILLVIFNVEQHSLGHEIIGLITFICYTIFPMTLLVNCILKKSKKNNAIDKTTFVVPQNTERQYTFIIPMILFMACITQQTKPVLFRQSFHHVLLDNFKKEIKTHGVTKYSNEEALIYAKSPKSYFAPDHNPSICWKGSGYTLKNETLIVQNNIQFYYAILDNNVSKLHTAWWFSNGKENTTGNITWRWNMIKNGESYDLINVTSSDLEVLNCLVTGLQSTH